VWAGERGHDERGYDDRMIAAQSPSYGGVDEHGTLRREVGGLTCESMQC